MRRRRSVLRFVVVFAAGALVDGCTPPVAPRAASAGRASPTLPIELRGTEGPLHVQVYGEGAYPGSDPPVAWCTTPCVVHLGSGRYHLFYGATSESRGGSYVLELAQPSRVWIEPRSYSGRGAWLAVALGGVGAIVAGAVAISTAHYSCEAMEGGTCEGSMIGLPIGFVLVTSGLITAPVGVIGYFNSFSPSVTLQPMNVGGLVPARGSVPVRERAGTGLGVQVAF